MLRKPGIATASATRSIAPVTKNTPRQPTTSPITPAPEAPSRLPRHSRKQQPADRDLPLLHRHAVAGDRQRNRKNAAGCDARDYAQNHQHFKVRGQAACNCGNADDEHAYRNEPCLAEHVSQARQARVERAHKAR